MNEREAFEATMRKTFGEEVKLNRMMTITGDQSGLAQQAQQEPVSQWISVKERLPEENTYVLCSYKRFGEWLVHEGSYDEKGRFTLSVIDAKVRYWMPLPPAPEEDKP